jgi:hypothetical protein
MERKEQIRNAVREHYSLIAEKNQENVGCCGQPAPAAAAIAVRAAMR